ncbi:PREDICTED: glucose-induced degradation protein 8 homolog [Camelina sativa]|uniref:Glucose-induced degradation protein 8 homolog n=1 Tax=Camelina sativa TaxID=90675 RepID=A0ABM0WTN7_CAMSA|nr:PREDICTED: glucose-induced degradation protein 8 homolog [Camelina sativa]XP_010476004.1 PREDICTED: glucose-induced degradation protein 8 homolog [Camelina sativa]
MADSEDDEIIDIEGYTESSKASITSEDWERLLRTVKIQREEVNRLVMNFFVVEGFLEAVEKFESESGTKPEVESASIAGRVAVVKAIQSGDLEVAVEKLKALNPEILKESFCLHQQRLIEIIRLGTTDKALEFAQKELKPFGEQNRVFLEELEKTLMLLGYEDLTTSSCPMTLRELLTNSQRLKTAAEVEAAILISQTGEKYSKLEHLLKMLNWTQNQLDEELEYPRMTVLPTGQVTVINSSE